MEEPRKTSLLSRDSAAKANDEKEETSTQKIKKLFLIILKMGKSYFHHPISYSLRKIPQRLFALS